MWVSFMLHLTFAIFSVQSLLHDTRLDGEDPIDELPKSIIDILSSNVEFSTFLRVIQRNGLIPYVNQLSNVTFIAPINSAFVENENDQVIELTSETLKRYIINEPIFSNDFNGTVVRNSLYYSSPNISYPLLLQSVEDNFFIDNSQVIETDVMAYNQLSIVQGVDKILHLHGDLCNFISNESFSQPKDPNVLKNIHIFRSLLNESCQDFENFTLLLPLDESLSFNSIEFEYLTTKYGTKDRLKLISNYFLPGYIGGAIESTNITNYNNNLINIKSINKGFEILINDTFHSKFNNILTSTGIIHIFNSSLTYDNLIDFTPRKYLIGLDATEFVATVDSSDLSYLIDDKTINQTLFIENSTYDSFSDRSLGNSGSRLLYHFVDSRIDIYDDDFQSQLIDSKSISKGLGYNHQKLKVSKFDSNKIVLNNNILVISDKIEIGNTIIYLIDDDLTQPNNLKHSIGPIYHCSRSITYFDDLNLIKLPPNYHNDLDHSGYSIFMPCYDSWKSLGMTFDYLEQNDTALKLVLENLIVNGLIYSDFEDELITTSLDNSKITISKTDEGIKFNDTVIPVNPNSDIFFNQGVVHPIQQVIFPDELEITLTNLIQSSDSSHFLSLLEEFSLSDKLQGLNYSIILPSPSSLKFENITKFSPDILTLLRLHIIPNEYLSNLLECNEVIESISGIKLECHELSSDNYMLKLASNDNNHEVRILKKGCTRSKSTESGSQSCVFLIDRPILPSWLDYKDRLHIHLPIVSMIIGIIIGAISIIAIVLLLIYLLGNSKDGEDENSPLLNSDDDQSSYGSNEISSSSINESLPSHNNNITGPMNVNADHSFSKIIERSRNIPV